MASRPTKGDRPAGGRRPLVTSDPDMTSPWQRSYDDNTTRPDMGRMIEVRPQPAGKARSGRGRGPPATERQLHLHKTRPSLLFWTGPTRLLFHPCRARGWCNRKEKKKNRWMDGRGRGFLPSSPLSLFYCRHSSREKNPRYCTQFLQKSA